jgi:hypothetical protein
MTIQEKKAKIARTCGARSIVLRPLDPDHQALSFKRLRCQSWLCPVCRRKKAKRFSLAVDSFFQHRRIRLLTLTLDRRDSLSAAWDSIGPKWNHFRTLLTQHIGQFGFVKVVEVQPHSQFPHLHILIDKFVPSAIIRHVLRLAGFGKIFDIKLIHGEGAKFYVKKYLKKDWGEGPGLGEAIRVGSRRISGSRGFRLSRGTGPAWQSFGDHGRAFTFVEFSILVGTTFQSGGWTLARADVFDDWIRVDWAPPSVAFRDLVSVFDLAPVGL